MTSSSRGDRPPHPSSSTTSDKSTSSSSTGRALTRSSLSATSPSIYQVSATSPAEPQAPAESTVGRRKAQPVRFGILARTTVTMLAIGVLPLVAFGALTLVQQARTIRNDARESLQASGDRIGTQVDEWIDKNVRMLRAAATLPAMTSMRTDEQAPVLAAINRAYPWIYLAHTLDRSGRNVGRSDGKPAQDYPDRGFYKDVMAGRDLAWETVIGKTSGKPAIILAVPIVANGAIAGVLVAAMTVEDISALFAHWRTGRTGYAFLVDDQAKVIAHPKKEFVLAQTRLTDHPLVAAYRQDRQPHVLSFTQSDANDALGYVRANRFGWAVAIQQDEDELFAPLRQTVLLGLVLLVAAAFFVALIARGASTALVRPILALSAAADRMSTGELDQPIPAFRADELGLLARSLDRLRISMRAAMARLR
jgi:methyl-accepting chemotaxis protein